MKMRTYEDVYDGFAEWLSQFYVKRTVNEYTRPYKNLVCFMEDADNFSVVCSKDYKPITEDILKDFFEFIQEDGKSKSFYNVCVNSFRRLSKYSKEVGLPEFEVSQKLISTVKSSKIVLFKKETIDSIITSTSTESPKDALAIALCYEGCCKTSWIKNLQVKDFDESNNSLVIYSSSGQVEKVLVYPQITKRTITLIKKSIANLQEDVALWNGNKRTWGRSEDRRADYIYQSKTSKVPSIQAVSNAFDRAVDEYIKKFNSSNQKHLKDFNPKNVIASKRAHTLIKYNGDIKKAMLENKDANIEYYKRLVGLIGLMY